MVKPDGQFIPVPTAVPPIGSAYSAFKLERIADFASSNCFDHPDISCPKDIGTAS